MESTVARWHIQGWNVAFREGYVVFDDRILNAEIIRRLPRCPDRIVLGSSRCMQLRREMFSGETFFNHGMRRGVLEDIVAVWQLYRRRGWRPKEVIIGVDAWLFDEGYWKGYWQVLRQAYDEIRNDWNLPPGGSGPANEGIPGINRWKRFIAATTSRMGVFFFKTRQDGLDELVRRSDGSVSYHAAFREKPAEQVADIIRKSTRFPKHLLSPGMVALFDQFIARLRADGVAVRLIIPPYHPVFHRLGGRNSSGGLIEGYNDYLLALDAVEKTVLELAGRHSAQVLGGFNPSDLNAGDDEFFDWMHPKPPVFERMLTTSR